MIEFIQATAVIAVVIAALWIVAGLLNIPLDPDYEDEHEQMVKPSGPGLPYNRRKR